jgi:hypothetical protein
MVVITISVILFSSLILKFIMDTYQGFVKLGRYIYDRIKIYKKAKWKSEEER